MGQVVVGLDVVGGDRVAVAEVGDQGARRFDLPGGRRALVEVADQADPDPLIVDLGVLGVAAVGAALLVYVLAPPMASLRSARFE